RNTLFARWPTYFEMRSAAGDRGPIDVSAHEKNQSVQISVSDCGPGVPDEALDKIFTPFYGLMMRETAAPAVPASAWRSSAAALKRAAGPSRAGTGVPPVWKSSSICPRRGDGGRSGSGASALWMSH